MTKKIHVDLFVKITQNKRFIKSSYPTIFIYSGVRFFIKHLFWVIFQIDGIS